MWFPTFSNHQKKWIFGIGAAIGFGLGCWYAPYIAVGWTLKAGALKTGTVLASSGAGGFILAGLSYIPDIFVTGVNAMSSLLIGRDVFNPPDPAPAQAHLNLLAQQNALDARSNGLEARELMITNRLEELNLRQQQIDNLQAALAAQQQHVATASIITQTSPQSNSPVGHLFVNSPNNFMPLQGSAPTSPTPPANDGLRHRTANFRNSGS